MKRRKTDEAKAFEPPSRGTGPYYQREGREDGDSRVSTRGRRAKELPSY